VWPNALWHALCPKAKNLGLGFLFSECGGGVVISLFNTIVFYKEPHAKKIRHLGFGCLAALGAWPLMVARWTCPS